MATSSEAGAQPLTAAGETQQAPAGSSQPVALSDDAAKITEMVNDPKQVGSVRKAVKFLAGLLNSVAKLRKMRADRRGQENATLPAARPTTHAGIPEIETPSPTTPELEETGTENVTPAPVAGGPTHRHLNSKEQDSNDTGEAGCWFSKVQTSGGNGKVKAKAKITSFATSTRTLYGKKVASAHKVLDKMLHRSKSAGGQAEHDAKDGGGNKAVLIAADSAVTADQSVGISIEDDTVSEDMVMVTLPQIVITPASGPDMPVQVVSPVSPSSGDLDDKPVDPVAPPS